MLEEKVLLLFSGPFAIFRVGHLPALYTLVYLGTP
jgi:hypothetical protein